MTSEDYEKKKEAAAEEFLNDNADASADEEWAFSVGHDAGYALRFEAPEVVELAAAVDKALQLMQSRGHQGLLGVPSILSTALDNYHIASAREKARGNE